MKQWHLLVRLGGGRGIPAWLPPDRWSLLLVCAQTLLASGDEKLGTESYRSARWFG
jgi:hypothetical protein